MHSRLMVVAAAAFAAALPVSAASAKKPDDNGKSDKAEKKAEKVKHDKADKDEDAQREESGKPANDKNLLLKGTVSAVDVTGSLVTVTVTGGNHAAQALVGQSIQFNVSSSILAIADSTGDGVADLNDVVVGDQVMVHAHVVSDAAQPLAGGQPHDAKQFKDQDVDTPVSVPVEDTTP